MVWVSLVFVFAGADSRILAISEQLTRWLAYLTAALTLRALWQAGPLSYGFGLSKPVLYITLLMWTAGWTLLDSTALTGRRACVRALPFLVLALTAVSALARSWTAQCILLAAIFLLLRQRLHGGTRTLLTIGFALLLVTGAGAIVYSALPEHTSSITALGDRMGDDTRSGQYTDFFADVHPLELLVGRGPTGTWFWSVVGDYQFFDNGFLWMLFIGGVPTLVSYTAIVLWPAFRLLQCRPGPGDAGAACMLLLWGVALAGLSTFTLPSISLAGCLVCLWAGRCHLALARLRTLPCPAVQQLSRPRYSLPEGNLT
jgi:hypothetical protein